MNRRNKKIELNEESLIKIINECDKDIKELKEESKTIYDNWKRNATEVSQIAVIGDKLVKLLDIRDKNIDKKLKLMAQLNTIIEQSNKRAVKSDEDNTEEGNNIENFKIPTNIIDDINTIVTKK